MSKGVGRKISRGEGGYEKITKKWQKNNRKIALLSFFQGRGNEKIPKNSIIKPLPREGQRKNTEK